MGNPGLGIRISLDCLESIEITKNKIGLAPGVIKILFVSIFILKFFKYCFDIQSLSSINPFVSE